MRISKSDVVRRQLETTIKLYFNGFDQISIHTLCCAAYEVLRDLNRAMKGKPMLKDCDEYVKPEYKKEVMSKLNEAQNFFKHAGRDPKAILDFNPDITEWLILDACWSYRRLFGEHLLLLRIFELWGWLTFAKGLVYYEGQEKLDPAFIEEVSRLPRKDFFNKKIATALGQRYEI